MSPAVPQQKKRSSAPVIPHAPVWHQRLAAWILFAVLRTIAASLRCRSIDRSGFFDTSNRSAAIYCVWHNRLALGLTAYFSYVKPRTQTPGLAAMVSASKDGGLLAGVLDCFGIQPVRGSSSRRGHQALLELTTWAERGYDLALTPDGPRGPSYVVQEGVMSLAQVTGLPIIPVSYSLGWKVRLKSWDGFQVPLPFSRCEFIYERPIRVSRDATDAEREALRLELEQRLQGISKD